MKFDYFIAKLNWIGKLGYYLNYILIFNIFVMGIFGIFGGSLGIFIGFIYFIFLLPATIVADIILLIIYHQKSKSIVIIDAPK